MDEQQNTPKRPVNPRRRKRSQLEIFKEAYLPVVIGCAALLLILIFIIGSITRGIQRIRYEKQQALEASIAAQEEQERLDLEAENLLSQAARLAAAFDYQGAIDTLDSFSGSISDYPNMEQKYTEYTDAQSTLVLWNDPAGILNLSFQLLIADPQRAFSDETYGASYNRNFITTGEFQAILQQLYENGYILVSLDDVTSGSETKELYLPEGKKPLILTQTNVNYNTYMIDGDGDKLPDKDGDGFASKLILDANGNITCQMVDATGETVAGAFDMVPILESFVETHPDFSYQGARAILAVTGYDGLFGYRTNPSAKEFLSEDQYTQEIEGATQIVNKLSDLGYELACYTYENEPYGSYNVEQISADLQKWDSEVTPILGATDIFVFSRNSDIGNPGMPYADEKFETIQSYGFNRYLGFCDADQTWFYADSAYARQGRILVTGSALAHHALWFDGIFDAASILDSTRGEVPA